MITDFHNDCLTPYDVADELCVSLTTVYNLLREGKLPGFKVGRVWRIPRDASERFIYALIWVKPKDE
ncbi:MAG: helix-turn-helix domain-containing protein [Oscillospiraceae bacterium]|nr:helix-turn-helix domain-containing protein [Oscillospiraceae bacterium]